MQDLVLPAGAAGGRTLRVGALSPTSWMLFGEAYSKSSHLFHVPLRPEMAAEEERRYASLALAALARLSGTEASEADLAAVVQPPGATPARRRTERQPLQNALTAFREIEHDGRHRRSLGITPQAFRYFNSLLIRGTPAVRSGRDGRRNLHDHAMTSAALSALCEVLNDPGLDSPRPERAFTFAFMKAVLVHLAVSGANLFPEAGAATATVIQHGLLVQSRDVPTRYAHLLSVFYGTAPERYRDELDRSRRSGDAGTFVEFSIRGYVSYLRRDMESLRVLWPQQRSRVDWQNSVCAAYPDEPSAAGRRQIAVAMAMPDAATTMPRLGELTATVYGGLDRAHRSLRRDLAALSRRGLVRAAGGGWQPCRDRLDG
jgi:hypothetical protein